MRIARRKNIKKGSNVGRKMEKGQTEGRESRKGGESGEEGVCEQGHWPAQNGGY